jgi:glucose-6-phosphate dehydrogenase assembly protein OpcA
MTASGLPSTVSHTLEWSGDDVDLTTVYHQINELRKDLSRQLDDVSPVVTHVFNLVVYTDSVDLAERVASDLASVSHRHPSRAIILIADRWHRESPIDAEVRLMCAAGTGGGPPLCFEQVFVKVQGRAADHLASVVVPLLMPEIPTYLWWPGQPLFGHRLFHRLLVSADQLVIDSGQFRSPGDGLNDLARLCSGRYGVNDINWARLKPWREIIAQFFDAPQLTPYAYGIKTISLVFGDGEGDYGQSTSGLLLLLGWVASELGMEPETTLDTVATRDVSLSLLQGHSLIDIDVNFRTLGAGSAGRLMSIEMHAEAKDAPEAVFVVRRSSDLLHAHVTMRVGTESEIKRVVALDIKEDPVLLADELAAAGHDYLYERVVEMAARIAGREVWLPE